MKITKKMIDTAENHGACCAAIHWLREAPRAVDELISSKPAYAAWALKLNGFYALLTAAQFEYVVRRSTAAALTNAPTKISDELLNEVALLAPGDALQHHQRLSSAVFGACVMAAPYVALMSANDQLTDTQRARCARRMPDAALLYAAEQLPDKLFVFCVRRARGIALRRDHACKRLSDKLFSECVKEAPRAALEGPAALARLSKRQLAACVKAQPYAALVYARGRLTPAQVKDCEARSPIC